ncbi:O-methyltransferase [Actinomarinicola tropica]|uniref:SAM-dependent methyltransferase n=1 Tax=Actinomarinicola tropica TaxID=2789776 RepID=A0A5Q2RHP9_9ACTN|nr:O-methyltransferase [Actinomarinicola tropica]QGG96309.1 SAM-dependent methyltransferase [Actinomarinicola tropica]
MDDAPKQIGVDAALHRYMVDHGTPPDEVLTDLVEVTRQRFGDRAGMQIDPAQGAFLTVLTRIIAPAFAVEVGTFTGYSSTCIARGLPDGGRLLCCDVSEEYTALAREAWARAGVADRVELRIGPALDTLRALPGDTRIDLAFIDADKGGYLDYYEEIVGRMGPGGVVLVDNVLWSGRVVDEADTDGDTRAIRTFNDHVAADDRVEVAVLAVGDGLTLARVR